MSGSRAWAIITVEPEDCVLLGTASNRKRTCGSWAFEPDEARQIARFLLQAADLCEGKSLPTGTIVFVPDEMEKAS